jgi:hypothetical protein
MVLFRAKTGNQNPDHLNFRLALVKGFTESHRTAVSWPEYGNPSIEPPLKRLRERQFLEKITASGKNSKPQKHVLCVLGKQS